MWFNLASGRDYNVYHYEFANSVAMLKISLFTLIVINNWYYLSCELVSYIPYVIMSEDLEKNCHQLDKFFRSPAGIGHVTNIEYKLLWLHTVPARPDMDSAFVVSTARGVEGLTHRSQNPWNSHILGQSLGYNKQLLVIITVYISFWT